MSYVPLWYLLAGLLLGNGMPHFAFGSAGKIFRSPFGQKSSAKTNILWGLTNFILATLVIWWRIYTEQPKPIDLWFLLIGFWLMVLMFGTGIKRFLNN